MKLCSKCNKLKKEVDFHKDKNRKDELYCFCKNCRIQETKEYKVKHKKEILNYMENYRQENYVRLLFNQTKIRAIRRGYEFNLNIRDIKIPNKCPVLGIPIFIKQGKGRLPNTPSIDRIDNTKGYTKSNTIVVSWRANNLKCDASVDELGKLYNFYKNRGKVNE